MLEGEARGVERRAGERRERLAGSGYARRGRAGAAVEHVPGDRVADRGEVDPDLVGAPGVDPDAQQRGAVEALGVQELRASRPRGARVDIRLRWTGSRPIAAVISPLPRAGTPWTRARYSFSTLRPANWRTSARCVSSSLLPAALMPRSRR
jgi:hypothetical protein